MNDKIPDLLQHVRTLLLYEEKLAHAQGDRFNIFEILSVGSLEVGTHSPYLAEFLNPKGGHGLDARPLTAFIRLFNLELDPATTRVSQEYYLGPVTSESGGRVDLVLEDKAGRQVAIENKLYAADQTNQIARYQKGLPKAKIIYLTLDGRSPGDNTTSAPKSIISLSYARDIITWQEECRGQAASAPLVRETITQYINLLKRLTNQSTNTRMSEQIVQSLLSSEQNLAAYNELVRTQNAVRTAIIAKLRDQCEAIAKPLNLKVEFSSKCLDAKEDAIEFFDDGMLEQGILISFQFERSNYGGLSFGIAHYDLKKRTLTPPGILEQFKQVFESGKSFEWWPANLDWNSRYNWTDETFTDIAFDRFRPELKDKVEKLLAIVRSAQAQT